MQEIQQTYDNIISIGWICSVSKLLLSMGYLNKISGVFDYVASPMWAVAQLTENGFDGFLADIGQDKLFVNNNAETLFDTRYFVRLSGTSSTSDGFQRFKAKTIDQGKEFLNLIKSPEAGTVLFIRQEESDTNKQYGTRINRPEFADAYATPEFDHLKAFSQTIKLLNPNLKFQILYLSSLGNFVDVANNIVGIPTTDADYCDPHIAKIMTTDMTKQKPFIIEKLKLATAAPNARTSFRTSFK